MKNILLSAFACDPKMGSEPYVGWNWLRLIMACNIDTHITLLTRQHHRKSLLSELSKLSHSNLSLVCFDLPYCENLDHRHFLMKGYYVVWQLAALLVALYVHLVVKKFSIIHHCTYNVVDMPGFLWAIPGTKFVWGPIGGGQVPPPWAKPLYGSGWSKQLLRRFVKRTLKFNPLVVLACVFSRKILVANPDTQARLPKFAADKTINCLETAIDSTPTSTNLRTSHDLNCSPKFQILWVGQLEARKGLPILFQALSKIRESRNDIFSTIRVDVIGTGPIDAALRDQCTKLDLHEVVRFLGSMPHSEVQDYYRDASLFVFTSVQDTSGNVILEAMSFGTPILAINHQGAKVILNGGGGVLVPPTSLEEVIDGFSSSIIQLSTDKSRLDVLSNEARANVLNNHQWVNRASILSSVYDDL